MEGGTLPPPSGLSSEICDNGLDDDADGEIDEGCSCKVGSTQPCYPGPATQIIGACKHGVQTCAGSAGAEFDGRWGACTGATLPTTEICGDGIDQDCDGADSACRGPADLCKAKQPKTLKAQLIFDPTSGCPWGQGDNLSQTWGIGYTARVEQKQQVTGLPNNAVLCSMALDIPGANMWFDDHLFVTFDDLILMTSLGTGNFKKDGSYFLYSWASLKGKSGGGGAYCVGGAGTCTLPTTQTNGTMAQTIPAAVAQDLGLRAAKQQRYDFAVITVGDNDTTDCTHSKFVINVSLTYVTK